MKGIVKQFPDIGTTIEDCEANNVGAENQWRRTGILTFDGNVRHAKKVTYERFRQHLQSVYKSNFSIGTTVQLCIACNQWRKSSSKYRGLAEVAETCKKGIPAPL